MPSKDIKLPKRLAKDVFRIIGIIHGDGNMSFNRIHITDKNKSYHVKVLNPLFKKVFNLRLNLYHDKKRNSYYSHIKNKIVYNYLTSNLEIPKGAVRKNLFVPKYVKEAKDKCKASYIGGIFDSEASICKRQAAISLSITCEEVHNFICEFLTKKEIKYSPKIRNRRKNKEYEIYIYGRDNIKKLLKIIKFEHPKKLSRLKMLSLFH